MARDRYRTDEEQGQQDRGVEGEVSRAAIARITFLGELAPNTGYGQHSAELIKALQEAGYFVSIRPFHPSRDVPVELAKLYVHCPQPEEWEIMLSPPHRPPTPGKRTVYFTMWESTRLNPKAVDNLNRCEHVIVPTEWNKEGFTASGVNVPISVVPLGVDREIFPYRKAVAGPMVFGAAGNLHNGAKRKGLDAAIGAFKMAFPKNARVQLWVKVTGKLELEPDPRIKLFETPLAPEELSQWYGRINCFVSCARSEGWGLMQLQAMSTGRPVIAASYAGMASYLDESVGYPVFYRTAPAEEIWKGLGEWAEPNIEHVSLLMRHACERPAEVQHLGLEASKRASEFTWKHANEKFLQVIEAVCNS